MTLLRPFLPGLALVLVLVFALFMVSTSAKHRATQEAAFKQTKLDLAQEKLLRTTEAAAYAADAERADAAYNRLRALNTRVEGVNDYVKVNPTSSNQCLDGADTDQLRDLWK
ncbi:hypothetical protein [Pararhizobium sp. A13]|uniref:hypothetical protein n=1 Tax=Pararhizobium sp. A13 TaxID=3133975 RepID=UPI0032468CA5